MSANQLKLSPMQMVTLIVLEAQVAALQCAANQLGGALKLQAEADVCIAARDVVIRGLSELQRKWAGQVVIAQPSDVKLAVRP